MLECSRSGAVEPPPLRSFLVIPVFHTLTPVIGMKQVCPSNNHQDDERFGLERCKWVVEGLYSVEGCLTGLVQQFPPN